MATDFNPVLDIAIDAAEDLSLYQYHFVTLDASGNVILPTAVTDFCAGVLQNTPASGESATIRTMGVSKVVCGNDAITAGEPVQMEYIGSGDAGKCLTSAADVNTVGVAFSTTSTSASEDELLSILLVPKAPAVA